MKLLWKSLLLLLAAGLFFAIAGIVATWAPDQPVAALKARWAPPPSQFIAVQGMQVHLRDEGPRDDPEPLVLLHGTSASLHTWDGWAAALRGQRRVIRVDLPGFALTGPQPQDDYSIDAYVRFVAALLDQLGVQRAVLAGNSLGGQIAWSFAAAQPQRVTRLVLVDAAGYDFASASVPLAFRIARLPMLAPLLEHTLPRGMVEGSVRNVYGDPAKVTPELVDLYYDMALREGNRRALGLRMRQRLAVHPERIATLKLPTLILWGGRDRLIPPDSARRFAQDIAGSRLVMFDDLGHVPHEEDPARTVAAVKAFLGP
ncbi:alpha/beta fold hydrolase [Variovorax terrae]|uniref:Alpha/beta fold hydrolase n=1 Tax=Variovorax terrae TaxID=2923278 RepID=A0A9X1VYF5_9BURK|nr:alpha/beta fold hydrolase [Variovorax terrae]MCJ0765655.1 alpha/beta fold hydrolase [Variovorax terrae]